MTRHYTYYSYIDIIDNRFDTDLPPCKIHRFFKALAIMYQKEEKTIYDAINFFILEITK